MPVFSPWIASYISLRHYCCYYVHYVIIKKGRFEYLAELRSLLILLLGSLSLILGGKILFFFDFLLRILRHSHVKKKKFHFSTSFTRLLFYFITLITFSFIKNTIIATVSTICNIKYVISFLYTLKMRKKPFPYS